ncbi:carbohydrate kinase family protein [Silvimonas sp.]|uniref:carbohydrate kinase family protein n=1 Tax=Silvimonas sp. TaxID=2650811 RepID=UPI00283E90CF|nr:carbohydrate kinase family protein [Silvimonas sp.]MDR3429507.1 carbohydrate kinase family protein [Silvimonas sp.]
MAILISGSIAYDTIMVFQDQFKNHLLPDQLHILSISFLVPEMRRELGGCAGNIAYSLKGLGDEPLMVGTVGSDFGPYAARLDKLGISRVGIKELPEHFTAQCFVTTDLDDNQIAAFHPGAMNLSHFVQLTEIGVPVTLGIVGPDGKLGMQERCRQLAAASVPFIFDPGQAMPLFSGEEMLEMTEQADYLTLNDYEAEVMSKKTGFSIAQLAQKVKALIVTYGAEGSEIFADGQTYRIPAVKAEAVVDPTGCGDAFRAGLLHGISHGWDWPSTGKLASLLGSLKIAQRGAQNHHVELADIKQRYQAAFGESWPS